MLIWLWLACVAKPLPAAAQTVSHKVTQQANVAVVKGQQQPKTAKTLQQSQPRMGVGSAVPGASETPDDSDEEDDSDDEDDIEDDDDSEMDGEEEDSDEDGDSEDDDDLDDDDD